MANVITRAFDIFRQQGIAGFQNRCKQFVRRRYHRTAARLQRVGAEIQIMDRPVEVVAGCMYPLTLKIRNTGRTAWNPTADGVPSYTAVAVVTAADGSALEGLHQSLPGDFAPGATREMGIVFEVPRTTGPGAVRVDLVHERCFWFSELGNPVVELPITIEKHSMAVFERSVPALDVTMDLTNKCPLKCIQCRKTYFETFDQQQDMDWDLFKRIAHEVFGHARSVTLSSAGEPLMTRNFLEAIELTKEQGVREISFITSGMHLNQKRAERIVDLGVYRVEFSLDGASADVYNKIRVGSNFDKVIEHIEYVNNYKKRRNAQYPLLRFNWVLMKSNIHELPAFIDLAARLGVEEVQCQHMVAFIDALKDEALVYDKERSNRFVTEARDRARKSGIRFYHPPLFSIESPGSTVGNGEVAVRAADGGIYNPEDAVSFERKTHPGMKDGLQLCTDPWRKIYLDWQGMVYPCCVWKEEPLGDIRKQSFIEIWHSDRYRQLREGLTVGPLGKSCAECSVITGGDINSERSYFF